MAKVTEFNKLSVIDQLRVLRAVCSKNLLATVADLTLRNPLVVVRANRQLRLVEPTR